MVSIHEYSKWSWLVILTSAGRAVFYMLIDDVCSLADELRWLGEDKRRCLPAMEGEYGARKDHKTLTLLLLKDGSFKQYDLLFVYDGRRYVVLLWNRRRLVLMFVFGGRNLCKMEGRSRVYKGHKRGGRRSR